MKFQPLLRWLRFLAAVIAAPFVLLLLGMALLYFPPVQRWAVKKSSEMLQEKTGLNVQIGTLSLSPFCDLRLQQFLLSDADKDTIAYADCAELDLAFAPLWDERVDVEVLRLKQTKINTKALLPNVAVRGEVEALTAVAKGAEWKKEALLLNRAILGGGRLQVSLADTAREEPDTAPNRWKISTQHLQISNTALDLSLPGDSMHVHTYWGDVVLQQGRFDLGEKDYRLAHLKAEKGSLMMNMQPVALPQAALFALNDVQINIDSLHYNPLGQLRLVLQQLAFREAQTQLACTGLSARVYADTLRMALKNLRLHTPFTQLRAEIQADYSAFQPEGRGTFDCAAHLTLGLEDVYRVLQKSLPWQQWRQSEKYLMPLAKYFPLRVETQMQGNMQHLTLRKAQATLAALAQVKISGYMRQLLKATRTGNLHYALSTTQLHAANAFLPKNIQQQIQLPDFLSLVGQLNFAHSAYDTHFRLFHDKGNIGGKAQVDLSQETYALGIDLNRFSLAHFVKGQKISPFTGSLELRGRGFDVAQLRSNLVAQAKIVDFDYENYPLGGTELAAQLKAGILHSRFRIDNALAVGTGQLQLALEKAYEAKIESDFSQIALHRLGVSKDTLHFGGSLQMNVLADKKWKTMQGMGKCSALRLVGKHRAMTLQDVDFSLQNQAHQSKLQIHSGDLVVDFDSPMHLKRLARQGLRLQNILMQQIGRKHIDQQALRAALPQMALRLKAGGNNPIANLLRYYHHRITAVDLQLMANAEQGLNGYANIGRLHTGKLQIDTIFSRITHKDEGLSFETTIRNNRRTNPNPFTATLRTYLHEKGVGAELAFADKEGDLGLNLGAKATLEDKGIQIQIYPQKPILAYRAFDINTENFVFWGQKQQLRADVKLRADDGTRLNVLATNNDSTHNHIQLQLQQLNLGELASVVPYLPAISGRLDGELHLRQQGDTITSNGRFVAKDFAYEGTRIGDIGANFTHYPTAHKQQAATAVFSIDRQEVAKFKGTYHEDGRIAASARLEGVSLTLANAFLKEKGFGMRGQAFGHIDAQGRAEALHLSGAVQTQEGEVYSEVYGVKYLLPEQTIPIVDSKIVLNNYEIASTTQNKLRIDGGINLKQPTQPQIDLSVQAQDFALVDGKRQGKSALFGKVLTSFQFRLKGTTERLQVRGNLDLLRKTSCSYLLTNSPMSVSKELEGLLTFHNFADSTTIEQPTELKVMGLDVVVGINIENGTHINCQLSNNGDSYVDVRGGGKLTLRMTPQGEMRLTGRMTVDEGRMNYELPVIPLRTFTLSKGAYVEFKGDMFNPTLAITATEKVRSVITENDRQRSVTFISGMKISRTLEDLGLEFLIESPDDLSIQNQLTAMSPEGRNKAAIALMATGMYITDDHLAVGGIKASNALNAFLQNEIQNIAGKALATIDLSFGMENGTTASGQSTTDYSFQFSKRFLNNRMNLVVGGKVSTGADAHNTAESFIDNIALEYRLDAAGKRYVRVFYDREAQDALEGTLMKTGFGLVLRRKSETLGELFLFRSK